MIPIFLLGGGWSQNSFGLTYARFIEAATTSAGRKILLVITDEADGQLAETCAKFENVFRGLGVTAEELAIEVVSESISLTRETVVGHRPTGVFVGGGLTPLYHRALVADRSWIDYIIEQGIVYGGFSAGSMIAPQRAILGGWQVERDGQIIAILNRDFSEEIDLLDVQDGLGLVPFAVDVHASQWGNFTRPLHAVGLGLVDAGWAIDEDTMIQIVDGEIEVHGLGHAYQMLPAGDAQVEVRLHQAGARVPVEQR